MAWILLLALGIWAMVPRGGSEWMGRKWHDWLGAALAVGVGFFLGDSMAARTISGFMQTWIGPLWILLPGVVLLGIFAPRGDSPAWHPSWGDSLILIPAILFGMALYNAPMDTTANPSKLGEQAGNWWKEAEKKDEENKAKAKEEKAKAKEKVENPPPPEKVPAEDQKGVKWVDGSLTVRLPVRNDGQQWIVEGNSVQPGFVDGSHAVTVEGSTWIYRSAKKFPPGGPRICLKHPEGKYTEEFQPRP